MAVEVGVGSSFLRCLGFGYLRFVRSDVASRISEIFIQAVIKLKK
jgi:hypothetical protein